MKADDIIYRLQSLLNGEQDDVFVDMLGLRKIIDIYRDGEKIIVVACRSIEED